MKKANIILITTIVLGVTQFTVSSKAYASSVTPTYVNESLPISKQQIIPQIDHIRINSNGKVDVYLAKPIPIDNCVCDIVYEDTEGKDQIIASPQTGNDGLEYVSFGIELSPLISVDKQMITDSLSFKLKNMSDGSSTKYKIDNKELLDVIKNTITVGDLDTLVSGENSITGIASTGTKILVEKMGIDTYVPIGSTVAKDNSYSFKLPHEASGLDTFYLTFTGKYGEKQKKTITATLHERDENLFYNPNMNNAAYGWLLDGPEQTITADDEGTLFTLNDHTRLGASQFKSTAYFGQVKISFDIKPMAFIDGKESARLRFGNVLPGGMSDPTDGRSKLIEITPSNLGKWMHVEYTSTENGRPPLSPFGFSTIQLSKLKIKNMELYLL